MGMIQELPPIAVLGMFLTGLATVVLILLLLILSVWACATVARRKNLKPGWRWLGLLSVAGLLVVAFLPRGKTAQEKLIELKTLRDADAITAEEYQREREYWLSRLH